MSILEKTTRVVAVGLTLWIAVLSLTGMKGLGDQEVRQGFDVSSKTEASAQQLTSQSQPHIIVASVNNRSN